MADDLRHLIREMLREALQERAAAAGRAPARPAPASVPAAAPKPQPRTQAHSRPRDQVRAQHVRIASDADLQALVAQLAAPGGIEAVRAGRLRFVLAAPAAPAAAPSVSPAPVHRLDGVITERRLAALAPGSAVRLGAEAVLTPLARDMARRLRLELERAGS